MGNQEIGELQFRRKLCQAVIELIDRMDDPRKPDALAEYQRQLAEIDAKIADLTGQAPDVVIGLKTAVLFPKV